MKRTWAWLLAIAAALGAAVAYQVASQGRDYRAFLERGDAALKEDQTFAAIEAYSGAIALRSDSMVAHLKRGEAYRRRGELDAAARDFQIAADLDPVATRPLEELGDVRYLQQRFRRAEDVYDRCLRLDDRAARVTYKVALARYRSGNLDGALAALATALRLNDRMPDAYYLQGLCLRDARRPADAQRALEKAVSIAPGMIAAREELADLYGSQRDRADELEQLQVLAGLDRDRIERQVAIGIAHARWAADTRETASRRAVHTDLAVLTLGSALERAPDDMQLHTALGRVWLDVGLARNDRGALGKAVEALESVGSADTGVTSDALTVYGRALLESGRTDLAERILQRATGRYPVESSAFAYYAAAAEQQRHWEAARTALVRYDALVPAGQDLAVRAGRIAALSNRLGDFATAVEWLERAVAGSPNDADLLGSLADAQFRNGDPAAAAATLKRALDKDPQNPDLLALQRKVR